MNALIEIFVVPAWYWLVTIIPAALGILAAIQTNVPEKQQGRFMHEIINLLPVWGWWSIAAVAFIVTTLISVSNFVKKHAKETESKFTTRVIPGVDIKDSQNISFTNSFNTKAVGNTSLNYASKDELNKEQIKKKTLRITDLVNINNTWITRQYFEDCDIYGPAVIFPVNDVVFSRCIFNLQIKGEYFWEIDDSKVMSGIAGVIGLAHCNFNRCRFFLIGVVGTKKFGDIFRYELKIGDDGNLNKPEELTKSDLLKP